MRNTKGLSRLIALLAASTIGGAARPAAAEGESLLMLGLLHDGAPSASVTVAATRRLARMGEAVVAARLSGADRKCRSAECMTALAQRHNVEWLFGGDISSAERSYTVSLWLFRASDRKLIEEQAHCEECDDKSLGDKIGDATGSLLERRRNHRDQKEQKAEPPPAVEAPPVLTGSVNATRPSAQLSAPSLAHAASATNSNRATVASVPIRPDRRDRPVSGGRWAAIGVLGAAAVAVLATSIMFSTNNVVGQCPSGPSGSCSYSPFVQMVGYPTAAVLGAGIAMTWVIR